MIDLETIETGKKYRVSNNNGNALLEYNNGWTVEIYLKYGMENFPTLLSIIEIILSKGICSLCGRLKDDVEFVDDPFDDEIHTTRNPRWLCADCYGKIAEEV